MSAQKDKVHRVAGDEIIVYVDGDSCICLKTNNVHGDPVELNGEQARELAGLLLALAEGL